MKQAIKRGRIASEINITPFTDVVLVLLIIFMITTPLLVHPSIKVKLPNATNADMEEDKSIIIMIDQRENVFVNDKKIGVKELQSRLTALISNEPKSAVVVKADKDVKYDIVIKVIDAAKQSGAKKFALGVELKK
ncbi:MAG: biopolymer transporter ExbD [Elusimicrobia bacterium]|nr:biopolymer transporter ExbD [Candidatus Liberimonas magnetica]